YFWQTVAGDVLAGDPHAPKRYPGPVVGALAQRAKPEHLFVAAPDIIVAIVRDSQLGFARPPPVGDQHRQRAIAWGDRLGGAIAPALGPVEVGGVAGLERPFRVEAVDVVAKGQRRQCVAVLPGCSEGG